VRNFVNPFAIFGLLGKMVIPCHLGLHIGKILFPADGLAPAFNPDAPQN
jgi:hypothetical protein